MDFFLCNPLVFWGDVGDLVAKAFGREVAGAQLVEVEVFETYYLHLVLLTNYSVS